MAWLGQRYAKTTLPIGVSSLLAHQLRLLTRLGVRRAVVVVGYLERQVREELAALAPPFAVDVVRQPVCDGIGSALGVAMPLLDAPFAVVLADCYVQLLDPDRLRQRLQAGERSLVVLRDTDVRRLRAGCVVEADASGRIIRLAEKPGRPRSSLRACGIYTLTPDFESALRANRKSDLRDEFELTTALDDYCSAGAPVFADAVAQWDWNITQPADLLNCNLALIHDHNVVSATATLGRGARLDRVVVGADAEVAPRARLQETVVFPGAQASGEIRRALITPARTIFLPERESDVQQTTGASQQAPAVPVTQLPR